MRHKTFIIIISSLITVAIVIVIIYSITIFLNSQQQKTSNLQQPSSVKAFSKEKLFGEILFPQDKSIISYDLKTNKKTILSAYEPIFADFEDWVYKNNHIFVNTSEGISRIGLKDRISNNIEFKGTGGPTHFNPSPDGEKLAFVADDGYPGANPSALTLYIADFSNNSISAIKKDILDVVPQWFNDSKHILYNQNGIWVVDVETKEAKKLAEKSTGLVGVSREGLQALWFENEKVGTNSVGQQEERPTIIFRSIAQLFPETKIVDRKNYSTYNSNLDNTSARTPFYKFPVIARDFKGINKIIPGKIYSHFFLEIESGKSEIYFTDSVPWGTFKKINPNNAYSYYLLDYSPMTRKVLALKYRWKGVWDTKYGMQRSNADASLVILDEGNYASTVAAIDNSNFYEKEILRLDKEVTPTYYSRDGGAIFSPDGKFVLAPLLSDSGGPSKFKIISADGKAEMSILENFGSKFYWVE